MSDADAAVPANFVPVTVVLPSDDQEGLLGYTGNARFVGFFWDTDFGGAVWHDGRQSAAGRSENFTFTRFIRPLAFLYNVNFGTRSPNATHLLVWDRQAGQAYMAPRESAIRFLSEHNTQLQLEPPAQVEAGEARPRFRSRRERRGVTSFRSSAVERPF
jgi:hypothetical protein